MANTLLVYYVPDTSMILGIKNRKKISKTKPIIE